MADAAEPTGPAMRDASAHAFTKAGPPVHTDSVHPPRYSGESAVSNFSKPATLNLSTSDISSNTNILPAAPEELTPPTSAISSHGDSQATESLSQQKSSQGAVDGAENDGTQEPRIGLNSQSPPPEISAGTKRTASGEVKRASVNGLGEVLAKSSGARHSHTSSSVSNGSKGNVLEVSCSARPHRSALICSSFHNNYERS